MKKIVIIVMILMQSYYAISDDNFLVKPEIFEIGQATGHYTQRNPSDDVGVIDMLVMHYTAENIAKTFKVFLSNDSIVSSHYVISEDGIIFSTIKDQFAARHAGNSYWMGITGYCPKKGNYALNLSSLGIEHINMGYRVNEMQPAGITVFDREWYPFDDRQMEASIVLGKYLVMKYGIKPENVVGHSDIAPKRKQDPGPLFPWKKFAEQGVGAWPNFETSWQLPCFATAIENNDLGTWLITHLHIWGYKLPDEQASAEDIIRAFQMHFRQHDIAGTADLETAAILNALICNYRALDGQCPCVHE